MNVYRIFSCFTIIQNQIKTFFFDNHAITVSYKNPNPPPPPKKGGGGGGALTSNFAKTHFIANALYIFYGSK